MKKKIYAAYGSNMNLVQMKKQCPQAEWIGTGILENYQLEFRGGGVATVLPTEGSVVPVVLWSLTQGCEKLLDIYEGYPKLYRKDHFRIESELGSVGAMAYVLTPEYSNIISQPTKSYLETIRNGFKQNGIDDTCLNAACDRVIVKF